jgi:hypothetical protein
MTIPVTLDVAKLMHTCMKTAFLTGQLKIHSDQQLLEGRDLWMVYVSQQYFTYIVAVSLK